MYDVEAKVNMTVIDEVCIGVELEKEKKGEEDGQCEREERICFLWKLGRGLFLLKINIYLFKSFI